MKVYDSQGRLKVVGFTGPTGPPGTQSVTCAELSATASLLSVAIDVVSNGLSALIVDHNILSNRVSVNSATGGGGSVTSAEVQVASAAATSADAHANAASAAATSVDGRVTSLNTFLASISARSVGVSAKGLQSAINAVSNTLSNEASARAASVQTASAAATSVDGRIASLSAFFASLSVRSAGVSTHGLQSILNTLSDRISAATGGGGSVTSAEVQVASAAATSADAHANTASAAATSADAHANTVSARVVSVSAELVSLVQITSAAATSADAHANTASAAATSADAHANTVSARAVSISAELASLVQIASAAATSADGHANTASAAATSVNTRVNSVNTALSGISARSVGNVSTHGLQSVIDALSNRISGVTGGAGSVTSTELSAAVEGLKFLTLTNEDGADVSAGGPVFLAASAASAFHLATNVGNPGDVDAVGLATSLIAVGNPGIVQTRGVLSLTTLQWDDITGQTGGLTIGSKYYVGTAGELTVTPPAAPAFVRPVGVAIDTTKMLINPGLVDDLGPAIASLSALSINGISTKGNLQSVVNTLSGRIDFASNAASIADVHANTASAAATSVNAHVNTVSARAVSISAELASLVNIVSARAVSISAELASLLASASAALRADITSTSAVIKADINSVSAAIMADVASHLASTSIVLKADLTSVSAVIKADIASVSAAIKTDIASVSAAIKTDINSVSAAILNDVASRIGSAQFKMVTTGAQTVATATFTKVSGLSLSIVASGFYEVHGQLIWSQAGAGSASAIFNFGMSMTAQPVMAMFRMMGNLNPLGASAAWFSVTAAISVPTQIQFGGNSAICATPSIMYSAKPQPGVSGSVTNTMFFDGLIQASTVQSQLKVVVAASTGAFAVAVQPGSYIRAFRIG